MNPDRHDTSSTHDVIVVGARPAGAATAMLLARAGLDVLVLDRGAHGADTLSTHALMRGAVLQLERWGLLPRLVAAGTPAVERVVFHYGDDVQPVDLPAPLYAPRRTVLDPILVAGARMAGAQVRYGVDVEQLQHGRDGRVTGVVARDRDGRRLAPTARLVVGADGMRSRVARLVAARILHLGAASGAVVYRYAADLPAEGYEWVYRPGVAGGLIPTNDGLTCVWVGAPTQRFLAERAVGLETWFGTVLAQAAPGIAEVLRGLPAGRLFGFAGAPSHLRQASGPGWALVGDSASFKDPISTHGITDALRDAELIADAIVATVRDGADERDAMGAYRAERDRFTLPIIAATDVIAAYDWNLDELPMRLRSLSAAMKAETIALADRQAAVADAA